MTLTRALLPLALSGLLCSAPPLVAADLTDADAILAGADAYRNFKDQSFTFDLELTASDDGGAPKVFGLAVEVKDAHTSLVRYVAPASERGKALLMSDNNLWFQSPNNQKPIRITPQQRLLGEASNGDVASTDFSGDYRPRLVGTGTIEGRRVYQLELTAKPGSLAAYQRLTLWVATDDLSPLKAEFFAPSGKPLKTAWYRRFRPLAEAGGKRQLVEIEIVNALNDRARTLMRYSNFKVTDLPASRFNPRTLANL